MAVSGSDVLLDPARDTLVNVNAYGDPVPSARFMGGREFDILRQGSSAIPSASDIGRIHEKHIMLLPSVEARSGPFPGRKAYWTHDRDTLTEGEQMAVINHYLALMTDTCLGLIGAKGPLIVEGPFANNRAYLAMLEAASGRPVISMGGSATGTAIGAALLCNSDAAKSRIKPINVPRPKANLAADFYAALWHERAS